MKINQTIENMLNHRSIRKWKNEAINQETLEVLFNVANRTSTSIGMQTASVIRVIDTEKRKKIAEIANQKYIEEAPEFWVFITDHFRSNMILDEMGVKEKYANNVDKFISGFTDAALMTQNLANAVESLGMGFTIFGAILNDVEKLIEILELPKYTMPVLGIGFGYPDQNPDIKPRMDYQSRIFTDSYKVFDSYLEEFKEYDEEMTKYYDLRDLTKSLPTFTEQTKQKYSVFSDLRNQYLEVAKKQGYDL